MTLAERYMNDKPIGVASDGAFRGILVYELHDEDKHGHHDYVVADEICGSRSHFRRQIVNYAGERAYIFKLGRRWYLDEIMRTN